MSTVIPLDNISPNPRAVTHLDGLTPQMVDQAYLDELGVLVVPSQETLDGLVRGSNFFKERLANGKIVPRPHVELTEIDINSKLEIHNYTGQCPTLTYEINPVVGCNVGCLYCLVTDGVHEQELKAYTNYHLLMRRFLKRKMGKQHYYYFSPKTEAFQEPTLQTGIAHNILREFIAHYEENPESHARMFIASKAGSKQLLVEHQGERIIDLLIQMKNRVQFNTSVSIMPDFLRDALEPFAAPMEERLDAVRLCQENGIMANSALIQPILLPYLTEENMHEFFRMLSEVNIINFKPEFLTACMENLALVGQLQGYYDRELEREIYNHYIAPENSDHKKQRGRTAPNRNASVTHIQQIIDVAEQYGMSTSICYWVREQLHISTNMIPLVNVNGFQCLGYQRRLFPNHDPSIENNPDILRVK